MLREARARWLATATVVVVAALAALFARVNNPPVPGGPLATVARSGEAEGEADGLQAFIDMNCTGCHSLRGQGNPTRPLDGIGARLDRATIRAWAVGEPPEPDALGGVAQLKARNADDPRLDAVLDLLARQR
jgi:mono/diheme cytochrome c family protein